MKPTSLYIIRKPTLFLSLFILFLACHTKEQKQEQLETTRKTLFEFLDTNQTGIDFENTIEQTEKFNFLLYEYLYNGGGVAIGDINNDGLPDIYFSGNMISNKLYLNKGNFKFEDITETAGVNGGRGFKTGVTMVDINNDGFLDIYVCKSALPNPDVRRNVLYINNGDLSFTEKAADYGLDDPSYSTQAYFFDLNNDGQLDLYLVNHPGDLREANAIKVTQNESGELKIAQPKTYEHFSDRLYLNKSNTFEDITQKAGILNYSFGLSAAINDFNNDGLADIYVANDYVMPDQLLINQGNNTFVNQLDSYFSNTSFSSMGSDVADLNNNGCFDLVTLDMLPSENYRRKMMSMAQNYDKFEKMQTYDLGVQYPTNTLQINSCGGTFSNMAFMNDVALTEWSWSVLLEDYDNDGLNDIHITNGYVRDITNNDYARYKMTALQQKLNAGEISLTEWIEQIPSDPVQSVFFHNLGENNFKNVSDSWNSGPAAFSNGSAYADLNNDGYLDLVVNNINAPAFIMKNNGAQFLKNNFLSVVLKPTNKHTNFGTKVIVHLSDGTSLTKQFYPTRGFLSSSQHRLHFGIKEELQINQVEIIWPNKETQTIEKPELNQILAVSKKPTGTHLASKNNTSLFEDVTQKLPSAAFHTENDYIDFKREALLHHKYSEEGPGVAVGDVNGDGLDDLYLGGAMGFAPKLFIQDTKGSFRQKINSDFENDKNHEDVSALFFDANGNGFLDLYVVSGGNEKLANDPFYQDRLYVNDGAGNFKRDKNALPEFYSSGGVVKAHDIDGDGQLDLFVGGRITPGRNPETPPSYLLKNNKGTFTEITSQWAENLERIGMVTDAVFADLDKDGTKELILSGEWMPITVFKFQNGKYKNETQSFGLSNKTGWWYSLLVEDLNDDGYPEIVAGNLGLNTLLKTAPNQPVAIYYKDFDNNGSLDAVLTHFDGNVSYPLLNRDRLLSQMIMLRKRFTRYDPYAKATINEIFTPQELQGVKKLEANHFEHTLFINQDGASFKAQNLPRATQVSVLKSIQTLDVNKDGKKDLLTGGNFFGTDSELNRFDASIGNLLLGDGNGAFKALNASESGVFLPGNVYHLVPITIAGKPHFWVVRNNDKSSLIKVR